MKYEVVPFEEKHWTELQIEDLDHALVLARGGPAYTAMVDGKVIGIGGVFVLWPGTGEAWALVSPGVKQHGLFFIRASRDYLDGIAREKNLERVQAAVQQDFDAGLKYIMALGFEYEGAMKRFFNGKTFLRFAKFY
jgi:hypothetical protein